MITTYTTARKKCIGDGESAQKLSINGGKSICEKFQSNTNRISSEDTTG